jgi:hypothetical protein
MAEHRLKDSGSIHGDLHRTARIGRQQRNGTLPKQCEIVILMDVIENVFGIAIIHFGYDHCYLTGLQLGGAKGKHPDSHGTGGLK